MSIEELQSTAENVEQTSETEALAPEAGATDTPEAVETDEQKNARVQAEAAEKAKQREEKRQQSVQRRFDELTADKHAARRLADQLAEQNAKILALLEGQKAAPKSGEPTRDQFAEYEDFVTARAEYRADQKVQNALEQFTKTQQETQTKTAAVNSEREIEKQFMDRRAVVEKEIPDYRETVQYWEPKIPDSVANMIMRMPDGPLISYHMAKNPSLEAQFRDQPDYMHGIILGQISATLKSPAKVTAAPTPGKPVATSKPGTSSEPPSDPELYFAWAKKHLR